jgi:thiamine biosynthesis lipoprotein
MAAEFEVFFNAGEYPEATEAAVAALDEVDRLEERLSVYRGASEVSRINALAADGPVAVEPDLFELVELAVRLWSETDGALDITAGPLSDVWGFSRRQAEVPSQRQLDEARARVGCDKLVLDAENRTVRFRVPGMKINLGAIGKGYALDCCAARLEAQGIANFMVHGGQSSVVARGSSRAGAPANAAAAPAGWIVGMHNPTRRAGRLAEIRLHDRALGTSGSEKQFFRHQGRRLSHVLDPRTGWPAEGVLSATVAAPTAALADAISTALFVMGPDRAIAWCEARKELAAILVLPKRNGVEMRSTGFAPGELQGTKPRP